MWKGSAVARGGERVAGIGRGRGARGEGTGACTGEGRRGRAGGLAAAMAFGSL